jgi:microcystin-dependent protein
MDPFVGEIRMVAFSFAPVGWALCNGQLLAIQQNTALFSLIGTYYGGNGTTNFALPNLQGRFPLHQGAGAGLPDYVLGQVGGSPTATLTSSNLPTHAHTFAQNVSSASADHADPTGSIPALAASSARGAVAPFVYTQGVPTGAFPAQNTGPAGGNQPFNIEPPYLCINFIIALQGIFPQHP